MVDDDIIKFTSEELGREVTEDELIEEIQDDIEEDNIEDRGLLEEEISEEGFIPTPETDMSAIAFLSRSLEKEDKISLANLTNAELGSPTLPVRFWRQQASAFDGRTLYDMPLVYYHLLKKAKINEDSSLSREAKALELAVTNKRIRERKSSKAVSDFIEHIKNKRGNR